MAERSDSCLVVGGAGGIGAATCLALAEAGRHVIVADLDRDRASNVAEALTRGGHSAEAQGCDATDPAAVAALRAAVGPVRSLVNLSGVARNGLVVKIADADFDLTLATHLKACLNTMRVFLPDMRRAGAGRVVNMSSTAARGSFGGGSYAAAKGGIEALTRSAALELAPNGVTVNCVAAGLVNTGIFLTVPEEYRRDSIARIPAGRPAEPSEIAACIRFLASDEASYVTGQVLTVCGGLTIGPV